MSHYVIVGSGVSGLYAAYFLSKRKHTVTLIDQATHLGGLLKSVPNEHGDYFDCGSHFLRDTGIPEVDNDLFKSLPDNWQRLPNLIIGTHFKGQFYDKSPFVNAHQLSQEDYNKGLLEFINLQPHESEYKNCYDYLIKRFGHHFTEHLFREPLEKFYNEKIENLAPLSSRAFDLIRVIAFTPEVTRELKKSKWFDDRLAFHYSHEGQSPMTNYYPKAGGIGQWVLEMQKKLEKNNVEILLGDHITHLDYKNGHISSYKTAKGKERSLDHLIWTIPQFQLLKLTGHTFTASRPRIRTSVLIDLTVDKPFLTDVYYTVSFSNKFKAFRNFLYPNATGGPSIPGRYCVCSEVITEPDQTDSIRENDIFEELKQMGWIDSSARLIYSRKRIEAAGFPVTTNEFNHSMNELRQFVEQKFTNVISVGKASAKVFFMNETLVDTHKTLKSHVNEDIKL